jgi:hypothetical protein
MFVMFNVEASIPDNHPLRAIKLRCDGIFKDWTISTTIL